MTNKTLGFLESLNSAAELPERFDVASRAKESLLDYIGVCYAGRVALGDKLDSLVGFASDESGKGVALGIGSGLPLKDAVFLNGINAHALDLDDGVNAGIIHLGSPIFSLLLPLAAKHSAAGQRLLEAVILGYEAAWTLAMSIQPGHKLLGYHATGTCGMLGAIIAGSHLLGLSEDARFRAFSTGCVSAGGTLKVLEDGSELKPYNVAKASLLSLVSLQMAKAGFAVPDDAMSGDRGFLKMMAAREDVELLEPLRGGNWAIMRTYTKSYAACRYCHPAIEAAIALAKGADILARDVARIEVRTYGLAVSGHDHVNIQGAASAKMSIPYGVAVGYLRGKAGLAEYSEESVRDPEVLALCSKVSVKADPSFTEAFPDETVAVVRLETSDGSVFERRVDHPLGEPENPLGPEGVKDKFRETASFAGMLPDWQKDVIEAVENVEKDLPRLFCLLEQKARR